MLLNKTQDNSKTTDLSRITERTRYRVIGIIIILLGIAAFAFFVPNTNFEQKSTFGLAVGGSSAIPIPDLVLPSNITIIFLSVICAGIGGYQLAKGFGKRSNLILGFAILLFIFAFLTWATRDKSVNLTGMLRLSLVQAIPLVLGALSGILCERSGVVNIAIEGLMLTAALVSVVVSSVTHNIYWGLLAGVSIGGLLALVHGILCIKYKVDQIISGMVINIFASGITSYIGIKFLIDYPQLNQSELFPIISIPGLSSIPILGPIFFNQNIFMYITFILLFVIHFALYYTRWGLRTRMVGEHPKAADTLGINVFRTRYLAVILGGMVAGLAGSYLTLGAVGRFNRLMTSGRGFIGLAAMIFGNWNPFGALGASLIFGFSSSLESKLSILQVGIPSQILLMTPYLATMIILVGVVGKVVAPAADGQPYEGKE
ncbi:MAG: ABC transporter permease [Anaerolineaceae bacterium]|nr:ABC transporter permease [Anaerolineaceae bacterium]